MSKKEESLTVVGIEIPDGGVCQGTRVKLSNGDYLKGISSITLHADSDTKLWQLTLKTIPDFVDQKVIEALLADVELVQRQSIPQQIQVIENKITDLQSELNWLKDNEQTMP